MIRHRFSYYFKQGNPSSLGITLIETACVLLVLMLIVVGVFSFYSKSIVDIRIRNASDQLISVANASSNYIKAHHQDLKKDPIILAGGARFILFSDLVKEGFISESSSDTNSWGQKIILLVKGNINQQDGVKGYSLLITTTAGSNIKDDLLGQLVQNIGFNGGLMDIHSSDIVGAKNSWRITPTEWINNSAAEDKQVMSQLFSAKGHPYFYNRIDTFKQQSLFTQVNLSVFDNGQQSYKFPIDGWTPDYNNPQKNYLYLNWALSEIGSVEILLSFSNKETETITREQTQGQKSYVIYPKKEWKGNTLTISLAPYDKNNIPRQAVTLPAIHIH